MGLLCIYSFPNSLLGSPTLASSFLSVAESTALVFKVLLLAVQIMKEEAGSGG